EALAAGETSMGPAQNVMQMAQVVRNTFIQGSLSIGFALLIVVVLLAALWKSISAIRSGRISDSEQPAEESHICEPAGLFATAEEKRLQAQWREWEAAQTGQQPTAVRTCPDPVHAASACHGS